MILFLLASSLQTAAPAAVPTAALPSFTDLPNVTVTHYDVSGKTVRDIHASVNQLAPRDPVSQRAVPATSEWSVNAAVQTAGTGSQCKITSAKLNFAAQAKMPRLVQSGEQPVDPTLLARWQAYSAQLEARQVAQLRFAYDRLPAIEQQIMASSCADWKKVASAALEKLKKDKAAARSADSTPQPQLTD